MIASLLPWFGRMAVAAPAAALALCLAAASPSSVRAESGYIAPLIAETSGKGPLLRVKAFRVNPALRARPGAQTMTVTAPTLQALADNQFEQAMADKEMTLRNEGWAMFNFAFGVSGAVSTVAENAAMLDGLSNVNRALTELGLFLTVWQVGLDLSNGDNEKAGMNAYKGLMSYGIGKWGWSTLQVTSVVFLTTDLTLNMVGEGAWLARTDAWRQAYTRYYSDGDAAARANELGPQAGYLRPTLEQRIAEIRGRKDGGRSINDWKVLLGFYYTHARSPERFRALIEAELDLYVSRFWTSGKFEEYVADTGRGQADFARGASLTQDIRDALENEHKTSLRAMFLEDILPEIAHAAWLKALEEKAGKLNRELAPELNRPMLIDISAYELSEPARFAMSLPNGGKWSGTLKPGETRRIELTTLAYIVAGLPDTIILDSPAGPVERTFTFQNGKASVVFGQPQAVLISTYERSESDGKCKVTETAGDGRVAITQTDLPAPPTDLVHFSMPAPGQALFGRYANGRWTIASPGTISHTSGAMRLGTPAFEDLVAITDCSGGFLKGDLLAGAECKAERIRIDIIGTGSRETRCTSQMKLTLNGVYLRQGDAMPFYSLAGPAGEALRNVLRKSINEGVIGGSQ